MEDKNEVLEMYVNDMLALEKHIIKAVERQLESEDTSRYTEAKSLITKMQSTLKNHTASLEKYQDGKGGQDESLFKTAVAKVAGVAAGLYDQIRGDKVSRMLRDDYTALCLASVSYHMLMTTALCWKDDELANLCEKNLNELADIIVKTGRIICNVVAEELKDNEKAPTTNGATEAIRRTSAAWKNNHA